MFVPSVTIDKDMKSVKSERCLNKYDDSCYKQRLAELFCIIFCMVF